jgi:hypothetical protein
MMPPDEIGGHVSFEAPEHDPDTDQLKQKTERDDDSKGRHRALKSSKPTQEK